MLFIQSNLLTPAGTNENRNVAVEPGPRVSQLFLIWQESLVKEGLYDSFADVRFGTTFGSDTAADNK